jgi:hypothetical protein
MDSSHFSCGMQQTSRSLIQTIEGVRTFANQQVTVSFWAKADASKPISVQISKVWIDGGAPSSVVDAYRQSLRQLTTSLAEDCR